MKPEDQTVNIVWSSVYAYDSSKLRNWNAPKTMGFLQHEVISWQAGHEKESEGNTEFALIIVPTDQVYDVLAPGVWPVLLLNRHHQRRYRMVEAGAQPPQLLADGEVVFSTA